MNPLAAAPSVVEALVAERVGRLPMNEPPFSHWPESDPSRPPNPMKLSAVLLSGVMPMLPMNVLKPLLSTAPVNMPFWMRAVRLTMSLSA